MGSCTVIASDKTGTLTVNQQTAKLILLPNGKKLNITGEGYNGEGIAVDSYGNSIDISKDFEIEVVNRIGVLANEASLLKEGNEWIYYGDAMDVALLGMSYKLGLTPDEYKNSENICAFIPYECERKFSAVFTKNKEKTLFHVKGAIETVLNFCETMSVNGEIVPIDKADIIDKAIKLAKDGYRVLAFASGEAKDFIQKNVYENEDVPALTLFGLVAFIDPLRPEAANSVKRCHRAGIKVIMITGDHPETAVNIARQLVIADGNSVAVTGAMLIEAGTSESTNFENLVASTTVFARVSPAQKLEIVDVLIKKGEFVAVTGDGVNDAPALKRANIGVAMGSGTDVAKEVGAMIIVDDNFSSIVSGVEEGRFAYDNVRKVIYLLISSGAAEVFLFLASIMVGLPLPLLAVQLLWLNLVTNGIQDVALAFEAGEPGAMKRAPRKPKEKIFNPRMINQTLVSSATICFISFGFWYWLNLQEDINEAYARNLVLLLIVFMQNFHAFNARSETVSAFRIPISKNYLLFFAVLGAQGLHILSMQIPFMQNILRIEPVTFMEWLLILGLAVPMIIVMELYKLFIKK